MCEVYPLEGICIVAMDGIGRCPDKDDAIGWTSRGVVMQESRHRREEISQAPVRESARMHNSSRVGELLTE